MAGGIYDVLEDLAVVLADAAADALATAGLTPPTGRVYAAGEPIDDCGDAIAAVWIEADPRPNGRSQCDPTMWDTLWAISIGRPCQPQATSSYRRTPDGPSIQTFELGIMRDAAALMREMGPLVPAPACEIVKAALGVRRITWQPTRMTPWKAAEYAGVRLDAILGVTGPPR